ncbi:hypothetical protein [Bernardetia sp.]|uniref:hypothetical protein n=1 Tax=Bernardetia sp. TaxID=1937974 RepID=UPI0025C3EC6D|nr:hypothetical protein [Bernardetia sp.]
MIKLKFTLLVAVFFFALFPKAKGLVFSCSSEKIAEAKPNTKVATSDKKHTLNYWKNSTSKNIYRTKVVKNRKNENKISLRKKLSILKLVLKNKNRKKAKKDAKKQLYWTTKHTLGLIAWAATLGTVMSFLTGNIIFGVLFSCIAIFSLILILFSESISKFAKFLLWLALGGSIALFFMVAFPLLTELILLFF